MNLGRPYADVIPGPRGRVLSVLAQLATPVTVRALAASAGVSPQGALDAVNDLVDAGLVASTVAGRSRLLVLNRDHLLVGPVLELVRTRERLVRHLSDELAGWKVLAGAWLFGSAARGDGGRASDIDLLLVAERSIEDDAWVTLTGELVARVRAWTGNEVQLVEHTRPSFSHLVSSRNPMIARIRSDGLPLTAHAPALLRAGR
jgi:predicted nucleotidyltransferase